jgi:Ras-related GTP-binding protein C/D
MDFVDSLNDIDSLFSGKGALIFVIDAQDDYIEALSKLFMIVTHIYNVNPLISFEIFIHKVDGLSDDNKIGNKFSY